MSLLLYYLSNSRLPTTLTVLVQALYTGPLLLLAPQVSALQSVQTDPLCPDPLCSDQANFSVRSVRVLTGYLHFQIALGSWDQPSSLVSMIGPIPHPFHYPQNNSITPVVSLSFSSLGHRPAFALSNPYLCTTLLVQISLMCLETYNLTSLIFSLVC